MKIEIEIPEWARGRRIIVLAGIECIADHHPLYDGDTFRVKVDRCSNCGMCCDDCPYLYQEGTKKMCYNPTKNREYSCYGDRLPLLDDCTITHKRVKIVHAD